MTSVSKSADCSGNMPRSITSACARMTAFVIPSQEWNTLSARFVTLSGMRTSTSPLQVSKARLPMRRTESGIWTVLNHDFPLSAFDPMAVTV